DGCGTVLRIAEPIEAVSGEHHTEVFIPKRTFRAGNEQAPRLRDKRGNGVLATEAVLQQQKLCTGSQARRDARHGALGIVGL
nr:hypothetical protein [Tanacetum cinerariifolium]